MGYFKWADQQLQDLMAQNPVYKRSEFPAKRLGMANQAFNSRMPGSARFQNNIFSSQGNTLSNINRNATDASQALALGAAAQGQADQSLGDLQLMEADWKKFGLGNLNDAYGAMADEDRMVEQGKQQFFQNQVSLKGAQAANKYAKRRSLWDTVSGIANLGVSAFSAFGGGSGKGGGEKEWWRK